MSQRRIKRRNRQALPMPDELVPVFKTQLELFRARFGREPAPGEPIFFDPDHDTPTAFELGTVEREIVAAMVKANIPPEKIYAFKKTGRIITAENERFLSRGDLEEWNAAIEEFRSKIAGKVN